MLKKILLVLFVLLAALGVGIVLPYTNATLKATVLFDSRLAQWGLVAAVVIGAALGVARGLMKKRNAIQGELVTRHGVGSFISHWGTAFGIFAAIYSGIMLGFFVTNNGNSIWFLPIFAAKPAQAVMALNVHYFAVVIILFGAFFFVADYIATRDWTLLVPNMQDVIHGFIGKYFLRRKWDKDEKYLASQKSAALPYMAIGLVILLSGAVKVAGHVWVVSANILGWATVIHDVFTIFIILFTLVHVSIIVLLGDWPAFRSWFTGTMSKKFVEHHHPVWFDDLTTRTNKS
jgi:cytochrome b subunit of formate dehydrogenase